MHRYVCIHGHFYQPPRENPWLELVEVQDSAYPYHDWNRRIAAECYAPNADSRILDEAGRITQIVNNYERISFNFGPTLLSWMELNDPGTYHAILEADKRSRERFSGHGSAMAQVYNHAIMPLASARDKATQVLWGIRDFEHRFGRRPEGMWLAETAVDLESLELLSANGIAFTILAPSQAARVRRLGDENWSEVDEATLDTCMPYRQRLASGRSIDLFFYNGPVSRAVAFERLLSRGEHFAHRLLGAFPEDDGRERLVHIATDGETYGHHHRFGNMALAYALHYIESEKLARITNYGEYLERFPATHEVEIRENTAWSCAHGVGRWQDDCGCRIGARESWTQAWRRPLRDALNGLRDDLAGPYERSGATLLEDPWAARDDYIDVVLDRSPASLERFLARHARQTLDAQQRTEALRLLEMQRQALLMFTSCGWFFDEISGIESVQILCYASRAIQLAEAVSGESLESAFLERLQRAPSNLPEYENGRGVYQRHVLPARVDLAKVAANFAAELLFEQGEAEDLARGFRVTCGDRVAEEAGKAKLQLGRLEVVSKLTLESARYDFAFLHFGDHNLSGAVRPSTGDEPYSHMAEEFREAFPRMQLNELAQLMERHFGETPYSLATLFRDEQRRILERILRSTLDDVETVYRRMYTQHGPLMRFVKSLDTPTPPGLKAAAELVLTADIRRELEAPEFDPGRLIKLGQEARAVGAAPGAAALGLALEATLERLLARIGETPDDPSLLDRLRAGVELARVEPFEVDLRKIENGVYRMSRSLYPEYKRRAGDDDEAARHWVERLEALGDALRVALPSE